MKLSNNALHALASEVETPRYDRSKLTAGIVHIGVGSFHRVHQALYLDNLFALGLDQDWAIVGAGVRPTDDVMRQKLASQDYLTTSVELSPAGARARVIGSMIDYLPVEEGNRGLIAKITAPEIRIVSLTVTEGGYFLDSEGGLDAVHPDIIHDAANPSVPRTVFGAIVAAISTRRDNGTGPITIMSCDNIEGNGDVTRNAVVELARMSDPALADWISQYVTFPNSMVDGIVPVTSDRERQLVLDKFGIMDLAPVTSETYRQWVVEDRFAAGRPSLEKVGVTFSDDVAKYERMKIRILNGGHAIITYPSALMDLEIVSDAMANPLIHAFFRQVETTEVLPHVDPIPDMTPAKYLDLIDGRFSNTAIVDTTRRLGFDGSSRQPKFILSSVADGLAAGSPVTGLALVSACWARYCAGKTDSGVSITANDPDWDRLKQLSLQARAEPLAWLSLKEVYGNVATDGRFAAAFAKWLPMLWERGTANTLGAYLADC